MFVSGAGVGEHLPDEFARTPDAAASAAMGEVMHYFLTKGDQFVIGADDKVVQGPAKLTDAHPFLGGILDVGHRPRPGPQRAVPS
ncbi:hypothetical protein ACQPYK_23220 [Streptosporangium sp. CA-135522]|uniref:hypothetical protein n=1 Tax=Streptosporangium sp. CA-135522 TaxID=3240072 RepID=UPI003D920F93